MTLIHSHNYDSNYNPAMPMVEIQVARHSGGEAIPLIAIVDSGADATQIPLTVIRRLQARKSYTGWLTGSAGGRYRVDLYETQIVIGNSRPLYLEVVGTHQNEVIIGRDVLNQFVVTLDAPSYVVTLGDNS